MKVELTLFQARYVQYLTLVGCSMRATAGYFFARYNDDLTFKGGKYEGFGGNQMDGIFIRERAIMKLREHGVDPAMDVNGNEIGYDDDSYEKWRKNTKKSVK